jgi:ribosomal 30S subunit maturation factor RimM
VLVVTDPVSWLMIEPGWSVQTEDGKDVGKVTEVVGDSGSDIFNGLAISTGLLSKDRYVPAERVGTIVAGTVRLELAEDDVDGLEEYDRPPPSEAILPPDRKT